MCQISSRGATVRPTNYVAHWSWMRCAAALGIIPGETYREPQATSRKLDLQLYMYYRIIKEKVMKDKEAIIEEVIAICKANEKNMYCDKYQLIDMIREVLKLYEN